MSTLWRLIIGAVIGSIAGSITSRKMPLGFVGNVIAGLLGSTLGARLFGAWGPSIAGMAFVPSVLGAVILVFFTSLLTNKLN